MTAATVPTIQYRNSEVHAMREHSNYTRCGRFVRLSGYGCMAWHSRSRRTSKEVTCDVCSRALKSRQTKDPVMGDLVRAVDQLRALRSTLQLDPVCKEAMNVFDDGLRRVELAVSSILEIGGSS